MLAHTQVEESADGALDQVGGGGNKLIEAAFCYQVSLFKPDFIKCVSVCVSPRRAGVALQYFVHSATMITHLLWVHLFMNHSYLPCKCVCACACVCVYICVPVYPSVCFFVGSCYCEHLHGRKTARRGGRWRFIK